MGLAQRQRQARQKVAALNKKGHNCQPIAIEGRAIATSFWGKAWCSNLERYSDYATRLPRGRSYVRSGQVIDLHISAGDHVSADVPVVSDGHAVVREDASIRDANPIGDVGGLVGENRDRRHACRRGRARR